MGCTLANETARDGWVTAIRTAKAAWLSSALNVAGDSTLTSSQVRPPCLPVGRV